MGWEFKYCLNYIVCGWDTRFLRLSLDCCSSHWQAQNCIAPVERNGSNLGVTPAQLLPRWGLRSLGLGLFQKETTERVFAKSVKPQKPAGCRSELQAEDPCFSVPLLLPPGVLFGSTSLEVSPLLTNRLSSRECRWKMLKSRAVYLNSPGPT